MHSASFIFVVFSGILAAKHDTVFSSSAKSDMEARKMTVPGLPRCCCMVLFVILLFLLPGQVLSIETLLGVGEGSGFPAFAAKQICRAVNRSAENVECGVQFMEKAADVLTNLPGGSVDMALVNSTVIFDALAGEGMFRFMDIGYDDLRLLLPLYREPITLLVRRDSGISRFSDLRGKRINGGARLSTDDRIFRKVLGSMGWDRADFAAYQNLPADHAQDYLAFGSGHVQAMLHMGIHPDQRITREITSGRGILMAVESPPITRLIASRSGFCSYTMAMDRYPKQQGSISTLATETFLITSRDIDEATIAEVVQAIYANREKLQQSHPALLEREVTAEVLEEGYLQPHPAASSFFGENRHGR